MSRTPLHIRALAASVSAVVALAGFAPAASAEDCTFPFRKIGPLKLMASELKRPVKHIVTPDTWDLDSSWTSTIPRLSQFVVIKGGKTHFGASPRAARALSIDGVGPPDKGWRYFSDEDPMTQPCEVEGKGEWQAPQVRLQQTRTAVRVSVSTQRTQGDLTGCILGPKDGLLPCPNLTRTTLKLNAPLGNRELAFDYW